jgi:hypothetical protein
MRLLCPFLENKIYHRILTKNTNKQTTISNKKMGRGRYEQAIYQTKEHR